MGNPLKKAIEWLADTLAEKIMEPIRDLTERVDNLEHKHDSDDAALECDLSVLDDRICSLIDKARERELAFLTLEVRAGNTPARALYESMGFQTVGVRKNYYEKPTEDAILMTVFLSGEEETSC